MVVALSWLSTVHAKVGLSSVQYPFSDCFVDLLLCFVSRVKLETPVPLGGISSTFSSSAPFTSSSRLTARAIVSCEAFWMWIAIPETVFLFSCHTIYVASVVPLSASIYKRTVVDNSVDKMCITFAQSN